MIYQNSKRAFSAVLLGAIALATNLEIAVAQESEELSRADAFQNWSVFEADEPHQCWMVSRATAVEISNDEGASFDITGDGLLYAVANDNVELYYRPGYMLKEGEEIALEVRGGAHTLVGLEGAAWPAPEDIPGMISQMKLAGTMTLSGSTPNGIGVTDTFSLMGFTDALNEINARCKDQENAKNGK